MRNSIDKFKAVIKKTNTSMPTLFFLFIQFSLLKLSTMHIRNKTTLSYNLIREKQLLYIKYIIGFI